MRDAPILSERLDAVAGLVARGRKTADIGTDHALLPVSLVLTGVTEDVTACDVAESPLANAKATVEKYGLSGRVKMLLSDGLAEIDRDTKEIIIAGMGGDLIARIILAAPWVKSPDVGLVLQPMTRAAQLRGTLYENGFTIYEERLCLDCGRVYTVMRAGFTGGDGADHSPEDVFLGRVPTGSPYFGRYAEKQIKIIAGMKAGAVSRGDAETARLCDRLTAAVKRAAENAGKGGGA